MIDTFFDTSHFMQRGHCGNWVPAFAYVYAISNALISVAYVSICAAILRFRFSWARIAKSIRVRRWFATFVLACGIGHLEGIVSFAWPAYHLFAVMHLVTAFVSWVTVFVLIAERD